MLGRKHFFTLLGFVIAPSCYGCAAEMVDGGGGGARQELINLGEDGAPDPRQRWGGGGLWEPEAPPQPPEASADPDGSYRLSNARFELAAAGTVLIDRINQALDEEGYPITVRWSDEGHPLSCGYDCATAPRLHYTSYRDRPNDWYAYMDGYIHLVAEGLGTERDIHARIEYRFECDGWETGAGTMRGFRMAPAIWYEGGSTLEAILDFIAAGSLSRYIDSTIAEVISGAGSIAGSTMSLADPACASLGVVSHYPDDALSGDDAIVWDAPPPAPTRYVSSYDLIRY